MNCRYAKLAQPGLASVTITIMLMMLLMIASGGGCASQLHDQSSRSTPAASESLVLPSPGLLRLDQTEPSPEDAIVSEWLLVRNDASLGSPLWLDGTVELVEVQHSEYLRTVNGRPREFSTTATRTIKLGGR